MLIRDLISRLWYGKRCDSGACSGADPGIRTSAASCCFARNPLYESPVASPSRRAAFSAAECRMRRVALTVAVAYQGIVSWLRGTFNLVIDVSPHQTGAQETVGHVSP